MAGLQYTEDCMRAVRDWPGFMSAPSKDNRKRPQGIRVFENEFIEKVFATAHPASPGLWFLPLIGYGLYDAAMLSGIPLLIAVGCVAAGFLGFTLLEYVLHRWLFHLEGGSNFRRKFSVFMMHGYHHEFPGDRLRLVAPPLMSWPLGGLVYAALLFTVGSALTWPLFAGVCLGYLAYDWIHYYTHHFRPTTRVGKFLRRYHMEHHFKDQSTHFGISSPLWDVVFGTYSRVEEPTPLELELTGSSR